MKKIITPVLIALVFSVTAYAWTTAQEAANRMGAIQVTEVVFDKNSDTLSDTQKSDLRVTVQEALQKGKIDEIKVLVWSDKEYPPETGKQGKDDINLAKNRIKQLKNYLHDDLKVSSIKTHNMAERPNALEKLFNTSDAKVKNTAENTGAAPTDGNTGLFDMKAQASKAAVMIFMKK